MLLLLLVAVDFGRLFATYIDVSNAAREGAAQAILDPTNQAEIAARAGQERNSQGQQGEGALTVSAACADAADNPLDCAAAAGGGGTGNTVTVTTSRPFTFLTPFIGGFFGGSVTLTSSSTAAVLGLAAGGGEAPPPCLTPPTASFTVSVDHKNVSLDASASSPTTGVCAISGYNWDMGDGENPNPPVVGRTASYTYQQNDTYQVTLTVTNPAGEASSTVEVTTGPGSTPTPTATATATTPPTSPPTSPPPVCNTAPTFTVKFTGNGNGSKAHEMTFYGDYTGQPAPVTWSWAFGDHSTGNGQTASRSYDAAGTYTVTLTVRSGSCVKTTSQQVAVP